MNVSCIARVEAALDELRQGRMIILTDDQNRENEGDLIFPAQLITADIVNFMIRQGTGIVCLALLAADLNRLNIPLMIPPHENGSSRKTAFTLSIEARTGVTTGVSAADRARTIAVAVKDDTQPQDLVKPGHVFPLRAEEGGVLVRAGHTEGATDLMRLAGFKPAAVLCEIMNADGSMARGEELKNFAEQHKLTILAIEDIIIYRRQKENLIEDSAISILPVQDYGPFTAEVVKEKWNGSEHFVLSKTTTEINNFPLVRIHSACLTGDLFGSQRCDCHQQFQYSLQKISEEGGILIYLNQEGRGIGLLNKMKAYALQEQGLDTIEANQHLGYPSDLREYYMAAQILKSKQFSKIRLLTNNPHKITDLKKYGMEVVERVALPVFYNQYNKNYLHTKQIKCNHIFSLHNLE